MGRIKIQIILILSLCNFCLCQIENQTSELSEYEGRLLEIDELARTLDSIGNIFQNLTSSLTSSFTNMESSILGNNANSTCPNNSGLSTALKVPLYIITPAILIGLVILIKKIGLAVAWLPSITSPFFKSFKDYFQNLDGGNTNGGGHGWGNDQSPQYGAPAPSPEYGVSSSLSRQTAILNSIDDTDNLYNQQQQYYYQQQQQQQPSLPSNNNNANPNNYNTNTNNSPYVYSNPPVSAYSNPYPSPQPYYSNNNYPENPTSDDQDAQQQQQQTNYMPYYYPQSQSQPNSSSNLANG